MWMHNDIDLAIGALHSYLMSYYQNYQRCKGSTLMQKSSHNLNKILNLFLPFFLQIFSVLF